MNTCEKERVRQRCRTGLLVPKLPVHIQSRGSQSLTVWINLTSRCVHWRVGTVMLGVLVASPPPAIITITGSIGT